MRGQLLQGLERADRPGDLRKIPFRPGSEAASRDACGVEHRPADSRRLRSNPTDGTIGVWLPGWRKDVRDTERTWARDALLNMCNLSPGGCHKRGKSGEGAEPLLPGGRTGYIAQRRSARRWAMEDAGIGSL